MTTFRNRFLLLLSLVSLVALAPSMVSAHGGGLDSNGGHNCNVGPCAGTYHYHGGGGSNIGPVSRPTTTTTTLPREQIGEKTFVIEVETREEQESDDPFLFSYSNNTSTTGRRAVLPYADGVSTEEEQKSQEGQERQTAAEPVTRNDSNDEFFLVIGALIVGGLLVLAGIGIGKGSK